MKDHLTTLPFELLCCIFALLPLSKEKVQAQLVNKACKAALNDKDAYSADTWWEDEEFESGQVIRLPLACLRHQQTYYSHELNGTPSAAIFVPATVQRLRLNAHNLASCPVLTAVTVLEVYAFERRGEYPPFPSHKFPAVESIDIDADDDADVSPLLMADFSGLLKLERFSCCLVDPDPFELNLPSRCTVHLDVYFSEADLVLEAPGLTSLDKVQSITCGIRGVVWGHEEVDLSMFSKFRKLQKLKLRWVCPDSRPWLVQGFDSLPSGIKSIKVGCSFSNSSMPSCSPDEARFERSGCMGGVLHRL